MSKRDNGEGSVYQRPDGRWQGRLRIGDGKRKTFYGTSRKDVQAKINAAYRDLEAGRLPSEPKKLVAAYLDEWLQNWPARRVRPTTLESYALNVKRLQRHLGVIRLVSLRHTHIQAAYDALLSEGLSPRTVEYAHAVLRMALKQAVRWGYIAHNPCELVTPPRPQHTEMRPLTQDEAWALLTHTQGDRLYPLSCLLVTSGLRIGEALALHWPAIDFDHGTLYVGQTVHRQKGQGLVFGEPKTEQSRRTVDLSELATGTLRARQTREKRERLEAGPIWQDTGLVFCTETGGPLDDGYVRRALGRALSGASLPRVRLHDLRHTAATFMFSNGVTIKGVQNALGHSTAKLTIDTYTHLTTDMRREAATAMDRIFAGLEASS